MNLQLVKRSDTRSYKNSNPSVSISQKGVFYINTKAMQLMQVNEPKKLQVFQDQVDKQKWFLNINPDGYCIIKPKSKEETSGTIFMSDIAKKIINSFYHIGEKSLKFQVLDPITFEGKKYFPLQLLKDSLVMDIPDPNGKP